MIIGVICPMKIEGQKDLGEINMLEKQNQERSTKIDRYQCLIKIFRRFNLIYLKTQN